MKEFIWLYLTLMGPYIILITIKPEHGLITCQSDELGKWISMSNCLLLQVKPKQEARVLENLQRQGGECYYPKIVIEKLSRG
jgi:hypothetical protein